MSLDLLQSPPLLTADLPGLGGRIKDVPEDFEGAEYFVRQLARRLGVAGEEIGTAGLKDRRAVTRQWVSVPAAVEPRLPQLEGDGLRLLRISRHGNKLRPGHLRGNRFRVRIRDVNVANMSHLETILDRLRQTGMANFYGPQRFGQGGETLALGLGLLRGEPLPNNRRFLRKLALSAVQAALFNASLAKRLQDGLLRILLAGDVMAKWPVGGIFTVEDIAAEQGRFDRREIVHTGPMFGKKMFPAVGPAAEREAAILHEAGLTAESFRGHGNLLQGTRRHNLIYIDDLCAAVEGTDVLLTFTLPAGSYATVLLREVMKTATGDEDG